MLFCSELVLSLPASKLVHSQTITQTPQQQWRKMNGQEKNQEILSLINHKMSVAALNQLAIEGFISYDCKKSFYVNDRYSGMQTLLRIQCSNGKGASSAIAYDEVRIILNRFEGNIESFEIQRISDEHNQSTFS